MINQNDSLSSSKRVVNDSLGSSKRVLNESLGSSKRVVNESLGSAKSEVRKTKDFKYTEIIYNNDQPSYVSEQNAYDKSNLSLEKQNS